MGDELVDLVTEEFQSTIFANSLGSGGHALVDAIVNRLRETLSDEQIRAALAVSPDAPAAGAGWRTAMERIAEPVRIGDQDGIDHEAIARALAEKMGIAKDALGLTRAPLPPPPAAEG